MLQDGKDKMKRKIIASKCEKCKAEYKERHLYCPQCGNKTVEIAEPLGRAPNKNEFLLKENILDEKYDFHHIRLGISRGTYIDGRLCKKLVFVEKTNKIIAIPRDLHNSLKLYGNNAPSDIKKFSHQFFMLQIIIQLYEGFDELFDVMIEHEEFKSYDHYKWWKDRKK